MHRQGDVIFLDQVAVPDDAIKQESDVIAEGEATGHAHRIHNGSVWKRGDDMFVETGESSAVTHEEHARLPLAATGPGMAYPVLIQREYDDEIEWRKVAD